MEAAEMIAAIILTGSFAFAFGYYAGRIRTVSNYKRPPKVIQILPKG